MVERGKWGNIQPAMLSSSLSSVKDPGQFPYIYHN